MVKAKIYRPENWPTKDQAGVIHPLRPRYGKKLKHNLDPGFWMRGLLRMGMSGIDASLILQSVLTQLKSEIGGSTHLIDAKLTAVSNGLAWMSAYERERHMRFIISELEKIIVAFHKEEAMNRGDFK